MQREKSLKAMEWPVSGGTTGRFMPVVACYDTERPHQGYRNQGKKPLERIEEYLESVRRDGQEYTSPSSQR